MKTIRLIRYIGGEFENQIEMFYHAICVDNEIVYKLSNSDIKFCNENDISIDCISQSKINLLIEKCNIKL